MYYITKGKAALGRKLKSEEREDGGPAGNRVKMDIQNGGILWKEKK